MAARGGITVDIVDTSADRSTDQLLSQRLCRIGYKDINTLFSYAIGQWSYPVFMRICFKFTETSAVIEYYFLVLVTRV